MNDVKSNVYAQKAELLLRLIPIIMEEDVFAIHGGTAINMFLKDLPRYSVDIDLTYIPLADRHTSLEDMICFGIIGLNTKQYSICAYFHDTTTVVNGKLPEMKH